MQQGDFEHRRGVLVFLITLLLVVAAAIGAVTGYLYSAGDRGDAYLSLVFLPLLAYASFFVYRKMIFPYYRRLEDANLELHLKQEDLLDTKDDLFIKFLGIYDVNYTVNSPRLFSSRLREVADITARVMEADACFIFLFDKKKEELTLAASNGLQEGAVGTVRVPLGDGIEGWVGRRLEPLMLRDFHADARWRDIPGLPLADYVSVYSLPLYVYSNGALVGLMEVFYRKAKAFTDEEINFFTTLSGIISTTVQNEQMQVELRKMNEELEQWIFEKTEELRASEERYRTLVEHASESIFVLSEAGDILFANEQAALMTGKAKYDLLHENLSELFRGSNPFGEILADVREGRRAHRQAELRRADGTVIPVDIDTAGLSLLGKPFIQAVVRDISSQVRLEQILAAREEELAGLKARLQGA